MTTDIHPLSPPHPVEWPGVVQDWKNVAYAHWPMWANMPIAEDGDRATYRARRRWPGPQWAISTVSIRRGEPIDLENQSPLERLPTARWILDTQLGSRIAYAPVEQPPWRRQRAQVEYLRDGFVVAAGYDTPSQPPLVHYSIGVDVRIGVPRRLEA